MRQLTTHRIEGIDNDLNDALGVEVLDEPGAGGACHEYGIFGTDGPETGVIIKFQNGPVKETGVNGVSHEALLAILIDRLEHFQAGPYACDENANALGSIRRGLVFLQQRTRKRFERGVEGTPQV